MSSGICRAACAPATRAVVLKLWRNSPFRANLSAVPFLARAITAIVLLAAGACTGSKQRAIAITHVSVIDVVSGATRSDNTVIITGNRIVYAGPSAGANIPDDARVLDGRGKFLIPGLWDMHVHAFVVGCSD